MSAVLTIFSLFVAACDGRVRSDVRLVGVRDFVSDGVVSVIEPTEDGQGPSASPVAEHLPTEQRREAVHVSGFSLGSDGAGERLVVSFTDNDQEAAEEPPEVSGEMLRDKGILRLRLHSLRSVDPGASDVAFDSPLVREAFAIFAPGGEDILIDIHLASPALAAVSLERDPAGVVVSLQHEIGDVPRAPIREDRVLVLEPRPDGDGVFEAEWPLTVSGYARTFEANVVFRVRDGEKIIYEDYTTATSWTDTWGWYEHSIDGTDSGRGGHSERDGPLPEEGHFVLDVGEYSAKDGTWDGVSVELRVGDSHGDSL